MKQNLRRSRGALVATIALTFLAVASRTPPASADELMDQRDALLKRIEEMYHPTPEQMKRVREVFAGSRQLGQGNPAVTHHAATTEVCRKKLMQEGVSYENPEFEQALRGQVHGAPVRPRKRKGGGRQGLHRPVRVSRHSLRLPGGLGQGAPRRPLCCARRWGSGCAMPTSGRVPAKAGRWSLTIDFDARQGRKPRARRRCAMRRGAQQALGAQEVLVLWA